METLWNLFISICFTLFPIKLKIFVFFLFSFYEDMKRDLSSVIDKVCTFLDCSLTKEKKEQLIEHLDIKNFRNNPAVNPDQMGKTFGLFNKTGNFIRQGKVGGWKEEFKDFPEMERLFDVWLNDQLRKSKVEFPDFS